MRLQAILAGVGLALAASAASAAEVEVKDAAVRVTVIPEARSDVKVEILTANPSLPLQIRTAGGKTTIDGDLNRKIRSCEGRNGRVSVVIGGVGKVRYEDMPQIVIRTPKAVAIDAGGAVFGAVGKSESLALSNAGCGDWVVANVDGRLKLNQAGSGDTRLGSVGAASLRVAGSGDIKARDIRGALDVDIAGSGDVWAASVNGPLDVKIAGSGDVHVDGGKVAAMTVSVAGSGDVDFRGAAQSLKARIAGSGDVHVKSVAGDVSKSIIGSGGVTIG